MRILYCWIDNNAKYAMREMRICIYNSMRYKTFGGVGVAYIRELWAILRDTAVQGRLTTFIDRQKSGDK
ncbi:MAG: hypothetical protein K9I82_18060 [Chitinophagaceae bacterium]|nr:hypothetical protein [Chitinophagaceae bacterium]